MERDDLIVNDSYAMAAHHSEEAGAAIRKKIWHGFRRPAVQAHSFKAAGPASLDPSEIARRYG